MDIIINPEYEALVPNLSKKEYNFLLQSIQENGLREPIIINDQGIILDGHHRWKVTRSLGIKCEYLVKNFPNLLEEKLYVIDANRLRRQLTNVQKVQLSLKKKAILQEITKLNMSRAGKGAQICVKLGRVNTIIANDSGVSARQVDKIEFVLDQASASMKEKVLEGKIKVDRAYKDLKNQHWLAEQISNNKKLDLAFEKAIDKITLYVGDFKDVAFDKLQADSVSLIFTDPLYHEDKLYLYKELAQLAEVLLKPGGSLITYIGQYAWHKILDLVEGNSKLKLWITFAILLEGPKYGRLYTRGEVVKWKPLLWFVKGDRPINPSFPIKGTGKSNYISDLIESKTPDKRFHDFAQNPGDAEYIMKFLTAQNDLILDPFVGGGSTAIACQNMKRRFVGIDIDSNAIEQTRANLRMNLEK